MILNRMFGGQDGVPADFGVELTPQTLGRHQADQRTARDRYHLEHPLESGMARDVAAEAARGQITAR
jgi:hypothetical protein